MIKRFLLMLLLMPLVHADGCLFTYEGEDLWEPSQTALIRYDDGMEDLYLKVGYEGAEGDFAWLVPTPSVPDLERAPTKLFSDLHEITKPDVNYRGAEMLQFANDKTGATVISRSQVGMYDMAVLSADDSQALYSWFAENNFSIPYEAQELVDEYIEKGWYFTVMKIVPGARLDVVREDIAKRIGASGNTTGSIIDAFLELDENGRYEFRRWLSDYSRVYMDLDHLTLDDYRTSKVDLYEMQDLIEDNIEELCTIINHDMDESSCHKYMLGEDPENDEFIRRMEQLKDHYIEVFNMSVFNYRGLIGFLEGDYSLTKGVYVESLMPGYAAEEAGLKAGDHISAVDGEQLTYKSGDAASELLEGKPGEISELTVNRGGEDLKIIVERRPEISYHLIMLMIRSYVMDEIRKGVEPDGDHVENEFYDRFIRSVFEDNTDKLYSMCEDIMSTEYNGVGYIDSDYVSCHYDGEMHVNIMNFSCQVSEGMYSWFDNCEYRRYYHAYHNATDYRDYLIGVFKDYLDRYQESSKEISRYGGYMHPVQFSFSSDEIIYPLKISQASTKDENEVLLYVLADSKVKAPQFLLEYASWIEPSDDLLKDIVDKKYFLTKMRRTFTKQEMDADLLIFRDDNNLPYRMTVNAYGNNEVDTGNVPLSVSYEKGDHDTIVRYNFDPSIFIWPLILLVIVAIVALIVKLWKFA